MTLRFVPNTYTLDEQRQEINNLASDVNAIDTAFDERVDDRLSALLSGGTGISATYNDAGNSLSLSIDFTEFNTDSLVEGTSKLFFTQSRARQSFSIAAEPTASGNGDLSYNNTTGVFTYTPAAFTLNDITTNGNTTTNSISVGSLTATSGSISVPTGQSYKINGTDVLTATTLGSGVTSSSLTSVGTLTSLTVTGTITGNGNIDIATGQAYRINNTNVLTATTLGSGVIASSLTSVGTLTSLTVTGAITANGGVNAATGQGYQINSVNVLTATTLGSGVTSSSLTSVGTLTSLTVTGAINANGGVNVATGQAYQINGVNVLTSSTLGSGVTSSSLTSVGTLTSLIVSGSITTNSDLDVKGEINLTGTPAIKYIDAYTRSSGGTNYSLNIRLVNSDSTIFLDGAIFNYGGGSEIYHNGIKKLETTSDGIKVSGTNINLSTSNTPASATATGTAGDIRWDADYIYVCVATDTWKRSPILAWT